MSGRGSYRPIHTVLLDTPEYQALTPDGRLNLLTLKLDLGPTGIDVFYTSVLEQQTGCGMTQISDAVAELEASGWIRIERNVFWIVEGLKHEPSMKRSNQKHRDGVANHVNGLPQLAIIDSFRAYYADWFDEPAGTSDGIAKADQRDSERRSGEDAGQNAKSDAGVNLPTASPDLRSALSLSEATASAISDFLAGLPPTQSADRWRAEIAGWLQGLNLNTQAASPETIGDAVGIGLADYLKRTDRDYSPRHVRSFVDSAIRELRRQPAVRSKKGRTPKSREERVEEYGALLGGPCVA